MASDRTATNMILSDLGEPRCDDPATRAALDTALNNRMSLAIANLRQARRDLEAVREAAIRALDAETANLASVMADGLRLDVDIVQRRLTKRGTN